MPEDTQIEVPQFVQSNRNQESSLMVHEEEDAHDEDTLFTKIAEHTSKEAHTLSFVRDRPHHLDNVSISSDSFGNQHLSQLKPQTRFKYHKPMFIVTEGDIEQNSCKSLYKNRQNRATKRKSREIGFNTNKLMFSFMQKSEKHILLT